MDIDASKQAAIAIRLTYLEVLNNYQGCCISWGLPSKECEARRDKFKTIVVNFRKSLAQNYVHVIHDEKLSKVKELVGTIEDFVSNREQLYFWEFGVTENRKRHREPTQGDMRQFDYINDRCAKMEARITHLVKEVEEDFIFLIRDAATQSPIQSTGITMNEITPQEFARLIKQLSIPNNSNWGLKEKQVELFINSATDEELGEGLRLALQYKNIWNARLLETAEKHLDVRLKAKATKATEKQSTTPTHSTQHVSVTGDNIVVQLGNNNKSQSQYPQTEVTPDPNSRPMLSWTKIIGILTAILVGLGLIDLLWPKREEKNTISSDTNGVPNSPITWYGNNSGNVSFVNNSKGTTVNNSQENNYAATNIESGDCFSLYINESDTPITNGEIVVLDDSRKIRSAIKNISKHTISSVTVDLIFEGIMTPATNLDFSAWQPKGYSDLVSKFVNGNVGHDKRPVYTAIIPMSPPHISIGIPTFSVSKDMPVPVCPPHTMDFCLPAFTVEYLVYADKLDLQDIAVCFYLKGQELPHQQATNDTITADTGKKTP